ncbi:MAG: hypothetical protein HY564_02405 [Candidatus Jacksonbacteria bacterium]|nr:hypothetical protein [Candidatus Jacksonbacteria bacterium]
MSVKKLIPLTEDRNELRQKIGAALLYYELPKEINIDVLEHWINDTNSPLPFITKVFKHAYFESETEAETLLSLLTRLWNVTPRRELGGLSPEQKLASELINSKRISN